MRHVSSLASILLIVVLAAMVSLLFGCSHKTYGIQEKTVENDTVMQHTIDSLIVELRKLRFSVELPKVDMTRITPDSSSVLEDSLYISTAQIMPDGTLRHTLASKKGAKLDVDIQVADTQRIHKQETYAVREREHDKETTVKVEKSENWLTRLGRRAQDLVLAACCFVAFVGIVRIVYVCRKKRRQNENAEDVP